MFRSTVLLLFGILVVRCQWQRVRATKDAFPNGWDYYSFNNDGYKILQNQFSATEQ